MEYKITTPCTAQDLAPLKAGDTVLLSGVVYTARDQAHKRMMEALDKGETLPFALEGSAIYYVGPTPERPGEVIGSAGPTTSGRMDAMSPRLLDLGNKIMIGKGKRDAAVKDAVVRNGAVYLAALGGAGALMAKSVQTLEVIAWPDLGCEAVRRLTVQDMPLTVVLDAHGGDLYEEGPAAYLGAGDEGGGGVEEKEGNLAPTAALAAALQAAEVLKLLTGKPHQKGLLLFDLAENVFAPLEWN